MKIIKTTICILTLIGLGFFIGSKDALAVDADIVISEIGAYESSDHEWLEIYNRGAEPVDLTGWKFFEDNANHNLTAFQGDIIVEPGEYAVIADVADNFKADYPDFLGTILDSAWTTLNENGEAIALKNKSLEIIESFAYLPAPNTSLQRKDVNLADYTETNWQIHAASNSVGRANEFDNNNDDNNNSEPHNQIEEGSIVINEFVSDPVTGEEEWIELFNLNDFSVDLTGWTILDGSNTATELTGIIEKNSFFVIDKPKGALNNSGDVIILNAADGKTIDEVYYGDWQSPAGIIKAPAANDPNSTARINDGLGDFTVTQTLTKGETNQITPLPNPIITTINKETADEPEIDYKSIIINEIFPNPAGSDLSDEFIELKNTGSVAMSLEGFQLSSSNKIIYKISGGDLPSIFIQPNQLIPIKRSISGLALKNNGDYVRLISPENKTLETIKFSEEPWIPENVSWSQDHHGDWFWSTTVTTGQENKITKLNHAPIINIYCPKQALKGEIFICDASDSHDLEGDKLKFTWLIGGSVYYGEIAQHQFNQAGTFDIEILIADEKLSPIAKQKIKIIIPEGEKQATLKANTVKNQSMPKTNSQNTAEPSEATSYIDLKNIKNLPIGTTVITKGVVSAPPNTFGKTIMYLSGSGTQLYMSKADWPELDIGDLVEIYGTVSESQGNIRIKLASAQDIVVLDKDMTPESKEIEINELADGLIDYLVTVSGKLIEKKSSKFYIQDQSGEAEIYINPNTKIKKTNYLEGDNLAVTGIVRKQENIFQILPRFQDDIVKKNPVETQASITIPDTKQSEQVLNFLIPMAVIMSIGIVMVAIYKKKIIKSEVQSENG